MLPIDEADERVSQTPDGPHSCDLSHETLREIGSQVLSRWCKPELYACSRKADREMLTGHTSLAEVKGEMSQRCYRRSLRRPGYPIQVTCVEPFCASAVRSHGWPLKMVRWTAPERPPSVSGDLRAWRWCFDPKSVRVHISCRSSSVEH